MDKGEIINTPRLSGTNKFGIKTYDKGNNAAGIVGNSYSKTDIYGCYVRNLTIRAYRTIGGILANQTVEYGGHCNVTNSTVSDVTLIMDQFTDYDDGKPHGWTMKDIETIGKYNGESDNLITFENCNAYNVNIVKYVLYSNGGGWPNTRQAAIGNVATDILPNLDGAYVDELHFYSSLLGGPSRTKEGKVIDPEHDADKKLVGVYVKGITLDGLLAISMVKSGLKKTQENLITIP